MRTARASHVHSVRARALRVCAGALPELEAEMRAALAHMPAQRFTGAWAATEAHADFSELGALRGQFVPVSAHELIGCCLHANDRFRGQFLPVGELPALIG